LNQFSFLKIQFFYQTGFTGLPGFLCLSACGQAGKGTNEIVLRAKSISSRCKRIEVAQGLQGPEQDFCKSVRSALPTTIKDSLLGTV
jgi:hypothetical protein